MSRQRSSDGYSLNELTDMTGVTSRTVRYYVSEGLLPPPVAAGPRSYYSDNHVQRLRLIGFMKDAYLPLREIRRRLQELNDDEIYDAIVELGAESGSVVRQDAPIRLEDAVAYEPLSEPAADQPRDQLEPQTWPFVASRPGDYGEPVPQEQAWRLPRPIKAARHDPHNSTVWRKLAIGDSAEFLVEERLYQRRKEQVDALVVWAQRILDGN
ncbi:MAG: MerR family transcriptional regulator [Thermomicrobiales bacterium]